MMLADVSRCTGTDCPFREHCLRFTTPPVPNHPRQSWMMPPDGVSDGDKCDYFMSATSYGTSCYMPPRDTEPSDPAV
jgi:hypothetical protein